MERHINYDNKEVLSFLPRSSVRRRLFVLSVSADQKRVQDGEDVQEMDTRVVVALFLFFSNIYQIASKEAAPEISK